MSKHNDNKQTDLTSSEEFRLMVESIQDYAIFRLDPEGRVASWNLGAERIEGYTAEEIIGQHFSAFYTPDNIAQGQPKQALEIARQEGRYEEESIHLRKDGSQFWAHLNITPLYEAKGLRGFSGIIRDITERKETEKLLREGRERYEVAVQGSNDGLWDWDVLTNKVYFSPRWKSMIGYEDHEIANDFAEFEARLHPDDHDRVMATVVDYLNGKLPLYQVELRFQHKDGSYRWVLARGVALRDEEGKPYRMAGSHTDITAHKETEKLLREGKEQYEVAVQGSNDGLWDWDVLTNKVYFSPRWKSMIGYEDHEIANDFAEFEARLHPDDHDRVMATVVDYLNGKLPVYEVELRLKHKNGSYRWILARGAALRDEEGKPYRMAGSHTDITAHKETERLLREGKEQYEVAVQGSNDGLWDWDVLTNKVYFSPRWKSMIGYEDHEVANDFAEFEVRLHPEDHDRVMATVVDYLNGKLSLYQVELRLQHKDGSYRWILARGVALRDEEGKPYRMAGSHTDITAHKQVEVQLAKQAAELATVAEISTTISTILDPQLMLQTVVDLTETRFGLYHAHIYLLNELTGVLALVAGAGEVGRQMVAEGRTIALDQVQSLVARAARTRQGIIVNNIRLDPGFLPHPLLPETLAEMAVPIMIGDKVLGVLDVQSEEVDHFTTNDVRTETTLAAQVAVALQNARSFEQAEKTLDDFNIVARRLTREGWEQYLEAAPAELAYLYDLQQVVPFQPSAVENAASDQPEIKKPLTIQGEAIGYVSLSEPQAFRDEAAEIIETVTERLSTHLENLRLSEQTEHALAEVEALYKANTEVVRAKTIDEALQALVYNSAFQRFDRVTLLFFDRAWTHERPQFMTPVALWERDNEDPVIAPDTHYTLEQFPVINLFSANQPTILTDIAADERTDQNTRALLVEELGMRSLVVFPLVIGGQWLGVITGQGYTPLSLNETDIRQLKSLTDQAATVIQTQRLFVQTQQTLNLTERLFEAGRRLNTAADLQAAVAAIVESTPLREINRALLLLFEQSEAGEMESAVVAANWYGGSGALPTTIGTRYPWQIMGTLKFALGREAVFFNDTFTDQRVDRFALEVFERQNIRALAVLPLWVGSHQLGVLLLEAEEIHSFTNNEMEPYIALAGQLAIVIDRQNLLEQTRAALAETSTLYQTSQALVVASSLAEILQAVASAEIVPEVSGVSLLTIEVDETGQPEWSTIAATWSAGPAEATGATPIGTRFYLPEFPMSQLWISSPHSVVLIGDVYHNERVNPVLEAIFRQGNITAIALMPVFVRGEWIGLISMTWSTPQTFMERHQRLFNSLALQAAVTVNNQLLLERTQSALVEQERLTSDLDNQQSTLQAVLQSIPAGVFVVETPTGRPILTNQQAQDLLGRGISPEATKEDLAEVYSAFRYGTDELYPPQEMPLVRAMSGEVTTVDDMEIRRPDGRNILLQVFGGPIRDVSGQITASVAIFQDITEQRRTAQEREQLLAEVQAAYRQFVQREWNQFLGESHGGKWSIEHQQSEAIFENNGNLKLLENEATQAGQIKTVSATDDQAAMVAPISLRGQVIGTLSLQDIDPSRHWTAEEMALVETVSEQLAQTVENLRLFEETQKRATREQLTREITDKMRALPDMDSIIQTGLAELARTLGVSRTYVKLTSKSEQVEDVSHEIEIIRDQLKQQGNS